ncbi:hypothetical protein Gpo141_00009160 [Globisporangium polare]
MTQRCRSWLWTQLLDASTSTYEQHGEYPLERLLAFHEYSQRTPVWRVFLILLLACASPLVFIVFLDVLPLSPPSDGWDAHDYFWVRLFLSTNAIVAGILVQIQTLVLDKPLSKKAVALIMAFVGLGCTGVAMLTAKYWAFPIPFMPTLIGLPFTVFLNTSMLLAIGTKDQAVLAKITKFNNIVGVQTTMMVVYPAFNAIFLKLGHAHQVAFVMVLPVIKVSYKWAMAKVSADLEDLAPAIIASVDLFDALYTTKCMQSAGSLWVGFAIIALDVLQNCVALSSLYKQLRVLRSGASSDTGSDNNNSSAAKLKQDTTQLLNLISTLVASKQVLLGADSIRIYSRNRLKLSAETQAKLEAIQAAIQDKEPSKDVAASSSKRLTRSVAPIRSQSSTPRLAKGADSVMPINPTDGNKSFRQQQQQNPAYLIQDAACLLHKSEAVVLVEYIETAVPVFYVIYLIILFHLPNRKYYHDMEHFDADRMHRVVLNILLYAALELLTLVFLNEALKRTFGFSAFYQLAFTLEHEWHIYQSNFVSWILMIFPFLLVHHGADFTFKFEWLQKHKTAAP